MFNHIYDILKRQEEVTKICYQVSKESKEFLEEILKDEKLFFTKTTKQHQRISLKWDITASDGVIQCVIKNAFYSQEKLSIDSREDLHISDISFKDIAGHKKVKDELNEIVTLLKDPKRLKHFDLQYQKGCSFMDHLVWVKNF